MYISIYLFEIKPIMTTIQVEFNFCSFFFIIFMNFNSITDLSLTIFSKMGPTASYHSLSVHSSCTTHALLWDISMVIGCTNEHLSLYAKPCTEFGIRDQQ